jgi:hypothetical protein
MFILRVKVMTIGNKKLSTREIHWLLVNIAIAFLVCWNSNAIPKDCGYNLYCRFGTDLRNNAKAIAFINNTVTKKIGTNLLEFGKADLSPEDSRWMIVIRYALDKPVKIFGNTIPAPSEVHFFVMKDDVQLIAIFPKSSMRWGELGPQSVLEFCRWNLRWGFIWEGKTYKSIKTIKGATSTFFYANGNVKAAKAQGPSIFEYRGKKYKKADGMIYMKPNGSLYSEREVEALQSKYDKENPPDLQASEILEVCISDREVDFIPDNIYLEHTKIDD